MTKSNEINIKLKINRQIVTFMERNESIIKISVYLYCFSIIINFNFQHDPSCTRMNETGS